MRLRSRHSATGTIAAPSANAKSANVAALKANPFLPAEFVVSGLVYDVDTGLVEVAVAPTLLRQE